MPLRPSKPRPVQHCFVCRSGPSLAYLLPGSQQPGAPRLHGPLGKRSSPLQKSWEAFAPPEQRAGPSPIAPTCSGPPVCHLAISPRRHVRPKTASFFTTNTASFPGWEDSAKLFGLHSIVIIRFGATLWLSLTLHARQVGKEFCSKPKARPNLVNITTMP